MKTRADAQDLMVPLTSSQIRQHANLDAQARYLAARGRPTQTDTEMSRPELDTIDFVKRRQAARTALIDADAAAILDQVRELKSSRAPHHRTVKQQAIDGVTELFSNRAPTIRTLLPRESVSRALLAGFMDERHIARPAAYPRSRLVHFKWLPCVVAIEAPILASQLTQATPDGFSGALGLGLSVAGLTTTFAVVLGWSTLRAIHGHGWPRLAAGAATILLASALTFVALFMAHFRHLAVRFGDAPDEAAVLAHLQNAPFDLTSQGLMLLLLTMATSAFAAFKGYRSADPIWGYETHDRAHVAAREDVHALRADLRGAITALRDHQVAPLLALPEIVRLKVNHLQRAASELQWKRARVAALDAAETTLAMRAVSDFRRINSATRVDGIVPAAFKARIEFEPAVAAIPENISELIEAAGKAALDDASTIAEVAIAVATALDQLGDRTGEIMVEVQKADPIRETAAGILPLRATLESSLTALLPKPIEGTPHKAAAA